MLLRVTSSRDLRILLLYLKAITLSYHILIHVFINKYIFINNNKAFKMLDFICRNIKNVKNVNTMKLLYYSIVRFYLDFDSIIWLPNYNCDKIQIENVQY